MVLLTHHGKKLVMRIPVHQKKVNWNSKKDLGGSQRHEPKQEFNVTYKLTISVITISFLNNEVLQTIKSIIFIVFYVMLLFQEMAANWVRVNKVLYFKD